jgi:hypothetical protein
LKFFNGGGFEDLASFPFYFEDKWWGATGDFQSFGDVMTVDGDVVYLNLGFTLNAFGRKSEQRIPNLPSGVWCYDPRIGIYHRWSPSISQVYLTSVTSGNTDTSTDIMTTAGTIPATGNPARYIRTAGTGITGLTVNQDYYIIKHSATTFSLATSKANALIGTKIDLTAQDSGTSLFHMYNLVDYGNSYHENSGAIEQFKETNGIYKDIIFGGDYLSTTLTSNDTLCMVVPFLENRGGVTTPKIFPTGVSDTNQKNFIKFRPLGENDQIRVYIRTKDVYGLPITSPNSATTDELVWTSPTECYTTSDLSVAKTQIDAGVDLLLELTAGTGAGQLVKINQINGTGTYSLVLNESVIGASSGGTLKSHFIIQNWEHLKTITNSDTDYVEIPSGEKGKFHQFLIELIGTDVTIEDYNFVNNTNQPAK